MAKGQMYSNRDRVQAWLCMLIYSLFLAFGLSSIAESIPLLFPWQDVVYVEKKEAIDGHRTITIYGAQSGTVGVEAEYKWLSQNMPRCRVVRQRYVRRMDRDFDIFDLRCSSGVVKSVAFDISAFFGNDNIGEWRFKGVDGNILTGRIDGLTWSDAGVYIPKSIEHQRLTGQLTCQVIDNPGDGRINQGRIRQGLPHGEWCFSTRKDGFMTTVYSDGTNVGPELHFDEMGDFIGEYNERERRWVVPKEQGSKLQ